MGKINCIDIDVSVREIYTNMLLIAISRRRDFQKLVKDSEKEVNEYIEETKRRFYPEGFWGLFFVEILSRKMGSSLGDVYNLSEIRKEEIICNILDRFNPNDETTHFHFDEDENYISFSETFCYYDTSFYDDEMMDASWADMPDALKNQSIFVRYEITFEKNTYEDGEVFYSVSIQGLPFLESDFVYESYVVWEGKEGVIADFIESVIKKYSENKMQKKEADVNTDASGQTNEVEIKIIETEPLGEENTDLDELITCIWEDTKTIKLLDKFEGYCDDSSTKYKHIVIENVKFTRYSNVHRPGFNFVIERGNGSDYVGDVTFTKFKKDEAYDLYRYLNSEITDEIIEQYLDKDRFYRFSKPYLLRAQNSHNRTGYGWEWNWSGGIGDYIEGTLYGETTKYFFVGVYITSGIYYKKDDRKPFSVHKGTQDIYKIKNIIGDNIVFYNGKIRNTVENDLIQKCFMIETEKGIKYIPVSYDEDKQVYYISVMNRKKNIKFIENGEYKVVDIK